MTSQRAFVAAFVTLSTVVAGALASIGTLAADTGDHGGRRDRRVHAAASQAQAQLLPKQRFEPPVAVRPPVLLVRHDDAAPSTPLVLELARYDVTVTGLGARTRATLVFRNDLGRVLDGELVFPLPEGALVSGFALDVNGRMMDGVVVEAHEARIAFETEVRGGVDPGLVEWVRGNNFRTRVFPIPARGRRTITLEYLTDLVVSTTDGRRDAIYELPLRFPVPLDELALKIEIVRGGSTPMVRSGLANLTFSRWEDRYVAETTRRNVQPGDDLRVSLPNVPREETRIETADTGETFFVVEDFPASAIQSLPPASGPRRIGIAWDASLSRAEADRGRDLGIIAAHLARLGSVEVEAIVFRNVPDAPRHFSITNGKADALLAYLREQPCDGATNFAAVRFPSDASYSLLFSDGLSTVGGSANDGRVHPVFVLSGDPRADHARLRAMAQLTGGAYFNLQRTTDANVVPQLGKPVLSLVSVDVDRNAVADLEPSGAQAVTGGRVRIAGRLLVPNARMTLRYGLPGQPPLETRTIALERPRSSKATGLVEQLWAQQRLASLGADPEANHDDLVRLGQRFSIVTPGTSLLVLETLEQYLQHDVTPPVTSPELRAAFLQRQNQERGTKTARQRDKTALVVAMWENRVAWWSRGFNYVPNFRFEEPKLADRDRSLGGAQGGLPGGVAPPPPPGAPQPAGAPARSPSMLTETVTVTGAASAFETNASLAARSQDADAATLRIAIKPWNPDTPYLRSLRAAAGDPYRQYLAERDTYGTSPAFYLDCANYLIEHGERDLGIRVLTSVAELKLEDARLLRVLAHRLAQVDELDLAIELFDRVLRLRPEEPQSYRDLALVLDRRAGAARTSTSSDDYTRALALFSEIVHREWDRRFPEIEVIALIEANRIQSILERNGSTHPWPIDKRLRRLLDFDVRVVLTWDTDQTDMDLWVIEPSGEKCFYSHASTTIGGLISKDFTGGYGPEEYTVRRAMGGEYQIKANFYGSRAQQVTGPTTVQATVVTDYGRPTEQRRALTIRLTTARDVVDIGAVAVAAGSTSRGVK
jgi:Ca-activated chloride channel family protein